MKTYTTTTCDSLIQRYIEAGGHVTTLEEGTLGHGLTVCHGDGLKTAVIQEVALNEWSSVHKVRMYNTIPKKYAQKINQ